MSPDSPATQPLRLLLVEQAAGSLEPVRRALPEACCLGLALEEGPGAADLISREKISLVFCDQPPGGQAGLEPLRQILRLHPQIPVIIVHDEQDLALTLSAFRTGAADVLSRPLTVAGLQQALDQVMGKVRSRAEVQRLQTSAERSLDDLVLLKMIGETASREGDLPKLLDRIVASIQTSLDVEIVSLLLCEETGELVIRAARGLPVDVLDTVRIAPGDGISGHVLQQGEAVLIEDLASDGRFPPRDGKGRYRTGSLLSVPIRYQDRVVGVLNVNNKSDGLPFTAIDQDLLQAIAHQTALAIENHKLVSHLLQKSGELERAHDDLYHLHHDRTRFVCNLSHELKTPLTSVLGFADLLVNFYDQIEADRVAGYLSSIHQEALHLEYLLSGMLRLFAIDSGSENWHWQELDLVTVVIDCLQVHELGQAELSLDLDCVMAEDLWPIWGDPDRVALLLDSLFDNAIKFNRAGGSIRIRSENRQHEGYAMVYFSIANEGATVPQESAEEIFLQYTQLGGLDAGKPSGIGIGLATCRAILRQMHGDIFLEPMSGEGTSLGLLLPTRTTYEELNHGQRRI